MPPVASSLQISIMQSRSSSFAASSSGRSGRRVLAMCISTVQIYIQLLHTCCCRSMYVVDGCSGIVSMPGAQWASTVVLAVTPFGKLGVGFVPAGILEAGAGAGRRREEGGSGEEE